jgi:hypothetical protein
MDEKIQVGVFGNFEFIFRKKGGKQWFNIYATVIDMDKTNIMLKDNSKQYYLVQKRDIKRFREDELIEK